MSYGLHVIRGVGPHPRHEDLNVSTCCRSRLRPRIQAITSGRPKLHLNGRTLWRREIVGRHQRVVRSCHYTRRELVRLKESNLRQRQALRFLREVDRLI